MGRAVKIQDKVRIWSGVTLENEVFVGRAATVGAGSHIGKRAKVEHRVVVCNDVRIHEKSIVLARNRVPDGTEISGTYGEVIPWNP